VTSGPLKSDYEALSAQEAGLLNEAHSSLAVYRPDLSYLGDQFMGKLPKSRYLQIETFHVRPGKAESFIKGARAYQEAYKELRLEDPWVVYQVTSGGPMGTYLVIFSMDALSSIDQFMARDSKVQQAVNSKMGDMMKTMEEAFSSIQTNLYRLNPKTSYVSKEFASADPGFWTKPASAGGIQSLARADVGTDPALIRRVQQALTNLGYATGALDGVAGKQTRSAVRPFQKDHNLPVTGIIDQETAEKLGI